MGQQYIGGNGQNPYAQQQPLAPRPTPYSYGYPGGMAGTDPRIAQALANPNGGDINQVGGGNGVLATLVKTFPGPGDMLKGAGLGAVVGLGFHGLTRPYEIMGQKLNTFEHMARGVDYVTAGKWLNQQFDPKLKAWAMKYEPTREFFMADAIFSPADGLAKLPAEERAKVIDSAVRTTVDRMEQKNLKGILTRASGKLKGQNQKAIYEKMLQEIGHHEPHQNLLKGQPWEKLVMRTVDTNNPGSHHILEKQLEALAKMPEAKTHDGEALVKVLRQAKEGMGSVIHHYTPLYESTTKLTAEMSASGIGPIGRGIRSFTNGMQRIFTGETMGWAAAKAGKTAAWLNPMPMLIGGMILAFPFKAAKDAPKGEKTKAFFQNLLGAQIFNLIGWDIGRRILNAAPTRNLLRGFAEKTPFFAKWLSKVPLLGGICGWSLGGIVIELGAGLLIGSLFEKVAHKFLNVLGFKLKNPDSNDPGKPSSAGMNPMQGKMSQAQAGQMGNSAFANPGNPAYANAGQGSPWQQNVQYGKPGPANWPAAGSTPSQPSAPFGQPNVPPGAPTSKAYGQPPQSQNASQQPPLSPADIMQNRSMQSNDDMSQQLFATSPSFDKSIRDILSTPT